MHGIHLRVQLLCGVDRLILQHLFVSGVDGAQVDGAQQETRDQTADQGHHRAYKYVLPKNTVGMFEFQKGSTFLVLIRTDENYLNALYHKKPFPQIENGKIAIVRGKIAIGLLSIAINLELKK
jgi:hypothetical protein